MKSIDSFRSGYTLVELLIAMTISMFLLLGVTRLFHDVGSTINETQSGLIMAANLNASAEMLRSDLGSKSNSGGVKKALAEKPFKISSGESVGDSDGYLEIIEGPNVPYSKFTGLHVPSSDVFCDQDNLTQPDLTVGDTDDILMFTAQAANPAYPYRGLVSGAVEESVYAEIAWFVRGTTLYRRVLLVDDGTLSNSNQKLSFNASNDFYRNNDVSVHYDNGKFVANTLTDLAKRENRFAHTSNGNQFPYPLYYGNKEGWYYFRLPILEESALSLVPSPQNGLPNLALNSVQYKGSAIPATGRFWDLWNDPNGFSGQNTDTGSLTSLATPANRTNRTGEDIVLTNVLSFDVKVWNPYWVPCNNAYWAPPQYVDLGQDVFYDSNNTRYTVNYGHSFASSPTRKEGFGFTLKGRYNASANNRATDADKQKDERLSNGGTNDNEIWNGSPMPCVFDSWTTDYELAPGGTRLGDRSEVHDDPMATGYDPNDMTTWRCPPPYTESLEGIQVTIRCFDPASGNIRQIRVTHQFKPE